MKYFYSSSSFIFTRAYSSPISGVTDPSTTLAQCTGFDKVQSLIKRAACVFEKKKKRKYGTPLTWFPNTMEFPPPTRAHKNIKHVSVSRLLSRNTFVSWYKSGGILNPGTGFLFTYIYRQSWDDFLPREWLFDKFWKPSNFREDCRQRDRFFLAPFPTAPIPTKSCDKKGESTEVEAVPGIVTIPRIVFNVTILSFCVMDRETEFHGMKITSFSLVCRIRDVN